MGMMKSIRKARKQARVRSKAQIKAAEARARKLAKQEAKADYRTAQLLDKAEKRLLREEQKGLKRKRKHEKDLAKAHMKRIEESGLTQKKAKNLIGAARVLIPIVLPMVYKALTSAQQSQIDSRAAKMGLTPQDLARHSGRGAELKARIESLRASVDNTDTLPTGFAGDARVRLANLDQAVRNAEHASPEQQRLAHNSIEQDLTELAAEVNAKQRS